MGLMINRLSEYRLGDDAGADGHALEISKWSTRPMLISGPVQP